MKMSARESESAAGPIHQRHATPEGDGCNLSVLLVMIAVVVFVERFDQIGVERVFGSFDHR